jgi:hypothetical protein
MPTATVRSSSDVGRMESTNATTAATTIAIASITAASTVRAMSRVTKPA